MSANPEDCCYLPVDPFLLSGNPHLFSFSMFFFCCCCRKWCLCAKVRICLSPVRIHRPLAAERLLFTCTPRSRAHYTDARWHSVLRATEIYTLHHTCSTFSWSPVPVRRIPSGPESVRSASTQELRVSAPPQRVHNVHKRSPRHSSRQ